MPKYPNIRTPAPKILPVKLNKTSGLQAKLVRTALSVPGLMENGLQHDYKNNLY